MADANCHGPDCFYTGGPADSHAKKGVCTGAAGYISDAEIKAIIKDPSRVNRNYIEGPSNSNILVYDETEWVAWMSSDVLAYRTAVYRNLNMGGTTNWAIDLENNVLPPPGIGDWNSFAVTAQLGQDPWAVGERHGNWSEIPCNDRAAEDIRFLAPEERWSMLDASTAWNDAIAVWKTFDRPANAEGPPNTAMKFSVSISNTFHANPGSDCQTLSLSSNCDTVLRCAVGGTGTGPAGFEIWNSIVAIHQVRFFFSLSLLEQILTLNRNRCLERSGRPSRTLVRYPSLGRCHRLFRRLLQSHRRRTTLSGSTFCWML